MNRFLVTLAQRFVKGVYSRVYDLVVNIFSGAPSPIGAYGLAYFCDGDLGHARLALRKHAGVAGIVNR